jgi:hypothetical protein
MRVAAIASEEQRLKETALPQPEQQTPLATQCHHPLHLAYAADYRHSQCPQCRLALGILDLDHIDHCIDSKGGVGRWRQCVHDRIMSREEWRDEHVLCSKSVKGGGPRNKHVEYDKDGKDTSHRYAKTRLHNLLTELEGLAEAETTWYEKRITATELSSRKECSELSFSATKSLQYYNDRIHIIRRIEDQNAIFSRNRGREWEITSDPACPHDTDDSKYAHMFYSLTPGQRAFIKASSVPHVSYDKYIGAPAKPKLRTNAHVFFNPEVHVRSGNDINTLRDQGMVSSDKAYDTYPLDFQPDLWRSMGLRRCHRYWRGYKQSQKVDTSGYRWKQNLGAWEEHVQAREEEWQEMDGEVKGEDEIKKKEEKWIPALLEGSVVLIVLAFWLVYLAALLGALLAGEE